MDPSLVKYFQKLNDAVARELSLQKTLRQVRDYFNFFI